MTNFGYFHNVSDFYQQLNKNCAEQLCKFVQNTPKLADPRIEKSKVMCSHSYHFNYQYTHIWHLYYRSHCLGYFNCIACYRLVRDKLALTFVKKIGIILPATTLWNYTQPTKPKQAVLKTKLSSNSPLCILV